MKQDCFATPDHIIITRNSPSVLVIGKTHLSSCAYAAALDCQFHLAHNTADSDKSLPGLFLGFHKDGWVDVSWKQRADADKGITQPIVVVVNWVLGAS